MEKILFDDNGEKLSLDEINEFEKKIGKELPIDFKNFLLENNGGCPSEVLFTNAFSMYDVSTGENIKQGVDVAHFLSLEDIDFDYQDILDEGYVSSDLIPFAYTSFDSTLLINTSKDGLYSAVYYVNYDQCFDRESGKVTPALVSNSFNEFIDSLHIPTKEELDF